MSQVGIQTIIYGQRQQGELAGVLADVAAAGFVGVETGNLFRQVGDEGAVRRLFAEANLSLCGCHVPYAELLTDADLDDQLRFLRALGSRYLICSGVGDREQGLAAYREAGKRFNEIGQRCRDAGTLFCYHNHAWEFDDHEGSTSGMDALLRETDPDVVKLCLDVYWLQYAGEDPARFIAEHQDRAVYFHLKDGVRSPDGSAEFRELGRGDVDLKAVYVSAAALNPEWIVYEQDRSAGNPSESARESRRYLREELGL